AGGSQWPPQRRLLAPAGTIGGPRRQYRVAPTTTNTQVELMEFVYRSRCAWGGEPEVVTDLSNLTISCMSALAGSRSGLCQGGGNESGDQPLSFSRASVSSLSGGASSALGDSCRSVVEPGLLVTVSGSLSLSSAFRKSPPRSTDAVNALSALLRCSP